MSGKLCRKGMYCCVFDKPDFLMLHITACALNMALLQIPSKHIYWVGIISVISSELTIE
jgi:hypothetical protein